MAPKLIFMDKNKKPVVAAKKPAEPVKSAPTAKIGEFAFGKENYRLMLIGLFFIALGFLLMIGGGSDDPKVFNYELFSFRRIT